MATFGEVFGVAFALEGISFFIEAIFIAIYVYGWDRIGRRAHFMVGIPMMIAGVTGSMMVIAVNGFMNNPKGFDVVDGRVVNPHPWEALFTGNVWHELVHMYLAGYLVAAFIVAGVYAVPWLKGRHTRYHRAGLVVPLTIGALAAPAQVVVGDWAGRSVAETQPTKLAAMEGLPETTKGAPFTFLGWYDEDAGEVKGGIEIPRMLSILAYHDPNATVQGLGAVPPDDRPPVNVVRFAFQTMVGIGSFLACVGLAFLYVRFRKRRLPESRWFYRGVVLAGPLSIVALIAGWVTTEVGRQPWVVYGYMRTAEAVTGARGIPIGYGTLVVVYLGLVVGVAWMLVRFSRVPLEPQRAVLAVTSPAAPEGSRAR
jgi:cytochrome d ubiquinol oxidase subunit I